MMEETFQGGYRFHGQAAPYKEGLPVVSVITVVFNSLSLIERTITSVIGQSYPNIEFIIIDGGSTDGTAGIIPLYEKHLSYWISEPDKGIYDAMNKGLAAATGDYVWFMNAGDTIYAFDTLEKVMTGGRTIPSGDRNTGDFPLIFYGDTMIVDPEYREIGLRRLRPPEVLTWKSFKKGMLVCHQAILVNREIAGPFDPQYKHSADFDWVLRALTKAEGSRLKAQGRIKEQGIQVERSASPTNQHMSTSAHQHIVNTHLVLCSFLDGGHSKKNIGISIRERFHSMVRHYGLIPTLFSHIPIVARFGWYYFRNKRF